MITHIMNKSLNIIYTAHNIKGRKPKYVNLWSMKNVIPFLILNGVPQRKIDILCEIYRIVRFGE